MAAAVSRQRLGLHAQLVEAGLHQLRLSGIEALRVFVLVGIEIVGVMVEKRGRRSIGLDSGQSPLLFPRQSRLRHIGAHTGIFVGRGQGILIVEHARTQHSTLHQTALVGKPAT